MTKRLLDAETRSPELEKLVLALVVASRKLRPYFHAYSIEVLTNYPLHQVLQKTKISGWLLKWANELGQFEVNFRTRMAIKGQALADFIVEFTYADIVVVARTTDNTEVAKVAEALREKNSTFSKKNAEQLMTPSMIHDMGLP